MGLSSLVSMFALGLAGAFGALARYLLGRFLAERVSSSFPLGTFVINVLGAFVIGLIFTLTAKQIIAVQAQLILTTGFLGGFTTFSTLNWETVQLVRGGNLRQSALYLGGTYALGLCAVILGMLVGQLL